MRKLGKRHKLWLSRECALTLSAINYNEAQDIIDNGLDDDRYCADLFIDLTDHFRHYQALISRKFKGYNKRRGN